MPRAALNDHAKDCDFQPNTDCDACYLWRQMDGHTTKGQLCFKTGTDENHVKVRRQMVDSRTVPQGSGCVQGAILHQTTLLHESHCRHCWYPASARCFLGDPLITCDMRHCHAPCNAQLPGNARPGRWHLPDSDHQMQALLNAMVCDPLYVRACSGGAATMLGGIRGWSKVA